MVNYHNALWRTVEYIADRNNVSKSHLAIACGMDATCFNNSKQQSKYGQPRWISTETMFKITRATGITPMEFMKIFMEFLQQEQRKSA